MGTDPGAARLNRLAGAVLLALALTMAVLALSGSGSTTAAGGRLGGDFPEFYGAGRIIREGDAADLYEAERQERSQEGLFGDDDTGYLDFAYPPVVAAVYAPLSALSYRTAFLLHVVLAVAMVWLALRLVRPMVPVIERYPAAALAGALAFYPLFRAVGSGQNTALTILCLAGAWRALHEHRELAAGVWLGALLFKPQLAVLVLVALVVSRRWTALRGAALAAGALWVASAVAMGPAWLGPFLRHGVDVPGNDDQVGGGGSVSLVGTAQRFSGSAEDVLVPIAVVASLMVAGACLLAWHRCDDRSPGDVGLGIAVLAAGTVLASPHVIFYDAGLLAVAGLWALSDPRPPVVRAVVAVGALSALGALDGLPVNPLCPLAAGVLAWLLYRVAQRDEPALPDCGAWSTPLP